MREALAKYAPDLVSLSDEVSSSATEDELAAILARMYPSLRAISIDYAVMEHAKNIVMARGSFGWDDVGSWPSISSHFSADLAGNVVVGTCEPMEAKNNIVISENRLTALIGVSGLVVVQSENATLVCRKERSEDVKKLLRRISERPDGAKYV